MSIGPAHPLYAPDHLLPALRDYLAAQNLVRKPGVAGPSSGPPYPFWLDPRRGVPYPGQTEGLGPNESHNDLQIGAYPATGIPSAPYEGFLVKLGATIWYRGRNSPLIQTVHEQIRGVLHDHRNINMNGLLVNQAQMTREIQRIGSGEEGYVYNTEYQFDMWSSNYVYNQ